MARENYRTGYEFSKKVRETAFENANHRCELCGDNNAQLNVHHILGIFIAQKMFPELAPAVIKCIENAQVLCRDCHSNVHIEETRDDLIEQANYLLHIQNAYDLETINRDDFTLEEIVGGLFGTGTD